jgi:hypothetical protein
MFPINPRKLQKPCRLRFTVTFVLISLALHAQIDPQMKRGAIEATLPLVVMPAPNSAVLTRTISENVDLYTGRLNLDIPLYTLKKNVIEVPISLQATADAHKVDDIGSWVGLGFRLNAGGMITRVMKNLPDEYNTTISPDFNFHGYGYLNLGTMATTGSFHPASIPFQEYTTEEARERVSKASWNTSQTPPAHGLDLQPDEFYFSFGKYSGKFVFDQAGNPIIISDANLQFTKQISNGKITGFTVYTDDGYRYEFGNYSLNAVEESKMKVKSKTLLYFYRWIYCWRAAQTGVSTTNPNTVQYPSPGTPVNVFEDLYETKPYVMTYEIPQPSTPNSSRVADHLIDFNYAGNQEDIEYFSYPSTWHLTKIVAPTGDVVDLTYVNNGTLTYTSDRRHDRALLESWNSICNNSNPGACGYNIGSEYNFLRTNGSPKGGAFVEPKKPLANIDNFWSYPTYGQSTLSTSTIELQSKRLSQINANNGLTIDFIAVSNRQDFAGDKKLDKISVKYNGSVIREFAFNYEDVYNGQPFEQLPFYVSRPVFHYNSSGYYDNISGIDYTILETGYLPENAVRYRMYLKTITETGLNNESLPPFIFDYYDQADLPFRTAYAKDNYGFKGGLNQQPTLAKLRAGVLKSIKYPTGGTKEFIYEISGNTTAWNGLRIQEIKEVESVGNTATSKTYTYGTFVPVDQALVAYAMPDAVRSVTISGVTKYLILSTKSFASSQRVNPEIHTRGVAGGYTFAEISGSDGSKYRVEFMTGQPEVNNDLYLVSSLSGGFRQIMGSTYTYPFPPTTSGDWKRGLLTAEYYHKPGNIPVKSVHYDYDFTSLSDGTGVTNGIQSTKYRIDYGVDWNWGLYSKYAHVSKWQLLKSRKERAYTPDGNSYLESTEEYTYKKPLLNGRGYLLLDEVKQLSNSTKKQVVQKMKYPSDYAFTNDAFGVAIMNLKIEKVFNAIIEQYTYTQDQNGNNKRYISGTLNLYDGNEPNLERIYAFQPSSTPTTFTESNTAGGGFGYDPDYSIIMDFQHNQRGQTIEQWKLNDLKEAFLWDYGLSLPVAKVVNAGIGQVAYSSFEADGLGGWTQSSGSLIYSNVGFTGKKSFFGILSKTVPAGNYTVTLWRKSNGSATVNGSGGTLITTVGDWSLYEWKPNNVTSIQVSGNYIDEVRLHPQNAQMTSYTFSPGIGMTTQNDLNNRILYYEYDGLGRLKIIRDQLKNIVKTYEYNYKQ